MLFYYIYIYTHYLLYTIILFTIYYFAFKSKDIYQEQRERRSNSSLCTLLSAFGAQT